MRLERLVGDLLDLGRLESGQFTLHPRPVDAGEVVAGAAEGFRLEAGRHDLGLEVRSVPVPMSLDPDRLAQIVGNLLGNAMRFARSTIVVEVHRVPEGVRFAVSNDGPGIPAADLPYIFERLYQSGQRPVRTESGSGLGLAIVRELVGAMNGTVTVSSPDTGGVSFRVELPDHGAPGGTVDPVTADSLTSGSAGFLGTSVGRRATPAGRRGASRSGPGPRPRSSGRGRPPADPPSGARRPAPPAPADRAIRRPR